MYLFDIILLENGFAQQVLTSKQLCVWVRAGAHLQSNVCVYIAIITLSCFHVPLFSHLRNTEHTLSWCVYSFVCLRSTVMDSVYMYASTLLCAWWDTLIARCTPFAAEVCKETFALRLRLVHIFLLQLTHYLVFIYLYLKMKLSLVTVWIGGVCVEPPQLFAGQVWLLSYLWSPLWNKASSLFRITLNTHVPVLCASAQAHVFLLRRFTVCFI